MFRAANDVIQLGKELALLANQQPGIAYDVDKQDVSDLKPERINFSLLHFLKEAAHRDIWTSRNNTLTTNRPHQNTHSIWSLFGLVRGLLIL